MACLQVCQPVCSTASSLYFGPLRDSSLAYQAVRLSCQQSVIRFIGLVILSVSHLNFAWQPTNACTVCRHLLTSPGSAHRSPPSPVAHTCVLPINTNCSSPARLHRRLVHGHFPHRARCPGMLFPRRSVIHSSSPSASSDNPWKLIFSTTILIDSVSLLFCTFIVFFSSVTARAFVTVSVYLFKCLFYLLSRGVISNDLERTLILFSRSHHSLTLNIPQTATDIKKTVHIYFCHNFVKFPRLLISFGI